MKNVFKTLGLGLLLGLAGTAVAANQQAVEIMKFIRFEKGTYAGLTDHAKHLIAHSRDTLRAREVAFTKNFKEFDTLFHAAHVNRLIKGNMFLYGPPGGAKSKFVKWIFEHESSPAFELQMHQMMTEAAFVGGQSFEAAKEGRFEINTEGSLATFKLALIDEMDKGNPSALAALLSLLNERQVMAGNKVVNSNLETIFSTSNANLYDMYQQFSENGLKTTATALLNRFTTIAFVPNWLPKSEQAMLDANYLASLDDLMKGEQASSDSEKVQSLELDWDGLRTLARVLLRPSEALMSASRDFVETLRLETIAATEFAQDTMLYSVDEILPYYPTAIYTERLRQKIHDTVLMSVLIDLLISPVCDNLDELEQGLIITPHNRLPVGPLSLWRSYLMLTTVTFGQVGLQFPSINEGVEALTIDFGTYLDGKKNPDHMTKNYKAYDKREEQNIGYIVKEQQRFKDVFLKFIREQEKVLKEAASFYGMFSCLSGNSKNKGLYDIERLIYAAQKS